MIDGIPAWLVGVAAFLGPALEASTLIGLIVPGESAMIFAGAVASIRHFSLPLMMALGSAGAIIGDSIGYALGARHGEAISRSRLGRLVGQRGWQRARQQLRKRGFVAVLFGRFPPVLRTLVPLLAGMARIPYRTFLIANVGGGIMWSVTSVLIGYAAGTAWRRVARLHGLVGTIILLILLATALGLWARRVMAQRRDDGAAHTT
jgi:membrane protein DedA with SNARE-associated domain